MESNNRLDKNLKENILAVFGKGIVGNDRDSHEGLYSIVKRDLDKDGTYIVLAHMNNDSTPQITMELSYDDLDRFMRERGTEYRLIRIYGNQIDELTTQIMDAIEEDEFGYHGPEFLGDENFSDPESRF